MMPKMIPKKQVFLSYKSSDPQDKLSGNKIKKILESISPDAVQVFASDESIHAGTKWRATIREQLRKSEYLIFLYTDPHANWDWCHFESGLFLGALRRAEDEKDDEKDEWKNIFASIPTRWRIHLST